MLLTIAGLIGAALVLCAVVMLTLDLLKSKMREIKLQQKAPRVVSVAIERLMEEAEKEGKEFYTDDLRNRFKELKRRNVKVLTFGVDSDGDITGRAEGIEAEEVEESVRLAMDRGNGVLVGV
ncbi:MAG: hypothetical protein IJR85_01030 [Synergistaceae bacterium]|nr:hypothetical protein [Synergistaceae bacterium]